MKKNKLAPATSIGIVGGMGPYTGVDLAAKLLHESLGTKDQHHLPVLLASFPGLIPDRGTFVLGRESDNPADPLSEVIRFLERSGADVVGIPCVTAHCNPIMDRVLELLDQARSSVLLLNLIDEVVRHIQDATPDVRRVGALSTAASFEQRVFGEELERAGFEVVQQGAGIQEQLVNRAIFDESFGIKSNASPVSDKARKLVLEAVVHLRERGAEAVILGCTELPLAVSESWVEGVHCIDPTRVLARALIREFAPDRLKPLKST